MGIKFGLWFLVWLCLGLKIHSESAEGKWVGFITTHKETYKTDCL